jgi:hypothetical protein
MRLHWFVFLLTCLTQPLSAQPSEAKPPSGEGMYRYRSGKGRVVYTNVQEQVPVEQRPEATMDLSMISLNTALGNEIAQRLRREHAALIETPFCERLRDAAAQPFWQHLWTDFAPLVVAAAILLLLLLFSPAALRRFGAPAWSKALAMAVPMLFGVGLLVFALEKTEKSIASVKNRAKPCSSDAFAELGDKPGSVARHAQLVQDLKNEIARSGVGSADMLEGKLSSAP